MGKPKRKLTKAEKAAKKSRQREFMTVFVGGKQKRVRRPPTIDGLSVDEFIRRNADPIWLHANEMWEYLETADSASFDRLGIELVSDATLLKSLAEQKADENWEYRAALKNCDLESEEIDAMVHGIHEEISAKIDCTLCGNCCRSLSPELSTSDVQRLARVTGMTLQSFMDTYLVVGEDEPRLRFRDRPCPLQSGNACSVYGDRPYDCRSFPHLHKPDFRSRLLAAIENCSLCPISYNVFERLKRELPIEALVGDDEC